MKEYHFKDCFKDLTGGNLKVKQSQYLDSGQYPIVDQGKKLIGGYTDLDGKVSRNGEVIIFGDHTGIIKFVDFDFVLGADGVKVIEPNYEKIHPKFAYYLFSNIELPSTGYDRRFKYLKRIKFFLPPLATQKKIAAILDAADDYRKKTKALIDKYDQLAQSLFLDMFGDPVTNPKGWEIVKFSDVGKLDRGKSKHRPRNAPELLGGKYPLVQTGDVANSGGYIADYKSTYSELGLKQSKLWKAGTLCITIAANIAKTGILTFDACFPDSVVGFLPNKTTNAEYVQNWLSFLQRALEDSAPESAQKNINLAILRNLDFPLPPMLLQNQFAERIELIEQQKQQAKTSLKKAEDLFNSLLQRAFNGELAEVETVSA